MSKLRVGIMSFAHLHAEGLYRKFALLAGYRLYRIC